MAGKQTTSDQPEYVFVLIHGTWAANATWIGPDSYFSTNARAMPELLDVGRTLSLGRRKYR
jgi:hypothetical protein